MATVQILRNRISKVGYLHPLMVVIHLLDLTVLTQEDPIKADILQLLRNP